MNRHHLLWPLPLIVPANQRNHDKEKRDHQADQHQENDFKRLHVG